MHTTPREPHRKGRQEEKKEERDYGSLMRGMVTVLTKLDVVLWEGNLWVRRPAV